MPVKKKSGFDWKKYKDSPRAVERRKSDAPFKAKENWAEIRTAIILAGVSGTPDAVIAKQFAVPVSLVRRTIQAEQMRRFAMEKRQEALGQMSIRDAFYSKAAVTLEMGLEHEEWTRRGELARKVLEGTGDLKPRAVDPTGGFTNNGSITVITTATTEQLNELVETRRKQLASLGVDPESEDGIPSGQAGTRAPISVFADHGPESGSDLLAEESDQDI